MPETLDPWAALEMARFDPPDTCPKHGPYSVFCRECDMEECERPIPAVMPDVAGLCERLRSWADGRAIDEREGSALLIEAATALKRMGGSDKP